MKTTKRDEELKLILEYINKTHMPLIPVHIFSVLESRTTCDRSNNICYIIARLEQTAIEILKELRNPYENMIKYWGKEYLYLAKLAEITKQDTEIQYDQIYEETTKLVDQRMSIIVE